MVRLSAIFVAVCMVLIAASAAAVLYLSFGFSGLESAVAGIGVFAGLILVNVLTTRVRDRTHVGDHIADLSRGTADLGRHISELGRRVAALETGVAGAVDKSRAVAEPLVAEINELGTLVKQLADTVAVHDKALSGFAGTVPAPQPAPAMPETAASADPTELGEPEARPSRAESGRFKGMERADILGVIRGAVAANRVDLYLQPIVTLPQRKVRYYEAMTRLRGEDGEVIAPADYLDIAESGGLMPAIDNVLLFRAVQVVRRLSTKNREVGLFCNISPTTLADQAAFRQMSEFLEANRALAPSLVFEFAQATVRQMGPIEHECLGQLAALGFRFSMDRASDLRIEPRDLAERGFRFVKVPAALLLNRAPAAGADIHPADFSDLLGRFGIDLIAEKIESEGTVVDLLDYDVRFGQGFLFSPPRPVRADVLQGFADRPPPLRAETPAGETVPGRPAEPPPAPTAEPRPAADRRSAMAQLARGVVRRA